MIQNSLSEGIYPKQPSGFSRLADAAAAVPFLGTILAWRRLVVIVYHLVVERRHFGDLNGPSDLMGRVGKVSAKLNREGTFKYKEELSSFFWEVVPFAGTYHYFSGHPAIPTEAEEDVVDKGAVYGNKAANLFKLNHLLSEIEGVCVPEFHGISHSDVQAHLKNYYPGYEKEWEQFVNLWNQEASRKAARAQLLVIQRGIKKAFLDNPVTLDHVNRFLSGQGKDSRSLMVRSTGNEDSDQLANAGGNVSEAGVQPNLQSVSKAIGRVIASYHSDLSLTQRALAGEDITDKPFTPVLLQAMIGEKRQEILDLEHIPISGVAYTREVLGQTEDLTQIQATFGHNEAVVNSQLPVDTFFVYADGTQHNVLRSKKQRLIADEKGGFLLMDNPFDICNRATLSPEQVKKLQKISQKIHEHYGKPMDIEWVYDPASDTFFIVQARPVVDRQQQQPSILNLKALEEISTSTLSLEGEAIVSNGGTVTAITHPEEVIADTTLERAFNRYWKLHASGQGGHIRAVVIKRPEAATSHYACTLREMGVAVFCCPEFEPKQLKAKESVAFIDPQQGKIVIVQGIKEMANNGASLKQQLQDAEVIKVGWYRHPIPAIESVSEPYFGDNPDMLFFNYHKTLLLNHKLEHRLSRSSEELRELLDRIGSVDQEEAKNAVKDLTHWLFNRVKTLVDPEQLERGRRIFRNVVQIGHRVVQGEGRPKMERLHAAKRIEALLMQEVTATVINADSLWQLQAEKKRLEKVVFTDLALSDPEILLLKFMENREIKRLKDESVDRVKIEEVQTKMTSQERQMALAIYDTSGKRALSSATKRVWTEFSHKIAASRSKYANRMLIDIVEGCQNAHIFEDWLNLVFNETAAANEDNIIDALQKLRLDFNAVQPHLKSVAKAREYMEQWNEMEVKWADPDKFDQLITKFKNNFCRDITMLSQTFDKIDPSDTLSRGAVMAYLLDAVDLYDKSVKAMRSSPQYGDKSQQIANFYDMLQGYQEIMNDWVTKIPKESVREWTRSMEKGFYQKEFCQNAIRQIDAHFKRPRKDGAEQLRPSLRFNVNMSAVDSGHCQSQRLKNSITYEDLFTLMHQNILASFRASYKPPWEKQLPPEIATLHKKFIGISEKLDKYGWDLIFKPNLLGIKYDHPRIRIKYNIPIKNHAAVIDIIYDIERKTAKMEIRIFGHNQGNRMDNISEKIFMKSFEAGLLMEEVPLADTEIETLNFSWVFNEDQLLDEEGAIDKGIEILMQAVKDTVISIVLDIKPAVLCDIDHENPSIWEPLVNRNKKIAQQWEEAGLPYINDLIKRCMEKKWIELLIKIARKYDVEVVNSKEPIEMCMANGFLKKLVDDPELFQIRSGGMFNSFTVENAFSRCARLVFFTVIDNSKMCTSFEEKFKKIAFPTENSCDMRVFFKDIHRKLFERKMILGKEGALLEYINFLAEKKQYETLAGLKWHNNEIYISEQDPPYPIPIEAIKCLENHLKGKQLIGLLAEAEVTGNEIIDRSTLKPNQILLLQDQWDEEQWIYVRVDSISSGEITLEKELGLKWSLGKGDILRKTKQIPSP